MYLFVVPKNVGEVILAVIFFFDGEREDDFGMQKHVVVSQHNCVISVNRDDPMRHANGFLSRFFFRLLTRRSHGLTPQFCESALLIKSDKSFGLKSSPATHLVGHRQQLPQAHRFLVTRVVARRVVVVAVVVVAVAVCTRTLSNPT